MITTRDFLLAAFVVTLILAVVYFGVEFARNVIFGVMEL